MSAAAVIALIVAIVLENQVLDPNFEKNQSLENDCRRIICLFGANDFRRDVPIAVWILSLPFCVLKTSWTGP